MCMPAQLRAGEEYQQRYVQLPAAFAAALIKIFRAAPPIGSGRQVPGRTPGPRISFDRWEDEEYVYLGATLPNEMPTIDVSCEGRSILIRVAQENPAD
ncbi:MAG: hypothetical protein U0790_18830 [Isosphaeraceae bacterium]